MTALLTFKGANGLGDPGVEHLSSLELVGVDHEIGSSKQDGWWMSKPSHAICSFAPIHKPIVVQKLVCEGTIQIVQAISKVQKFARLELQIFNSDGIPSLQYTLFDAFIFE